MTTPVYQIVESDLREATVPEDDAEKIMDEVLANGERLRRQGKGKEIMLSEFGHPIQHCPAWAVEVWRRRPRETYFHKETLVYFDRGAAELYYDQTVIELWS